MTVREFARLVGASQPAISKACKTGRLDRSVTRDARGRVIAIDPTIGVEEWRNKGRLSPAERAAPLPGSAAAEVARRVSAIIDADLAEERGYILALVPVAVEGAIEGLRALRGREPTAVELVAALRIAPSDEDAGLDLVVGLRGIVEGDGTGGGGLADEQARQVGRDVATGGRDGVA